MRNWQILSILEHGPKQNETTEDFNLGLEYDKYLQEVVSILESDQEFKKKLENAKVRLFWSCKYICMYACL